MVETQVLFQSGVIQPRTYHKSVANVSLIKKQHICGKNHRAVGYREVLQANAMLFPYEHKDYSRTQGKYRQK